MLDRSHAITLCAVLSGNHRSEGLVLTKATQSESDKLKSCMTDASVDWSVATGMLHRSGRSAAISRLKAEGRDCSRSQCNTA